jgi:hypothetical protein
MPRHKKYENRHFPVGFSRIVVRGNTRFRFRRPDGKDFYFPPGTLESNAIEAATIYNKKYRNPTIRLLLNSDPNSKPISHWLPIIKERVRNEELKAEKISENVFNTFCLDIDRLEALHGNLLTQDINLETVNSYLSTYVKGKSDNVYNAKLSFLKKVFSYLLDDGAINKNYANNKKIKPKPEKDRIRIDIENFNKILQFAPKYLNIAMRLSLQTTHAVNEISTAKYSDCIFYSQPRMQDGHFVFGTLRIHRQKVKNKEASRVEIPITQTLKDIIDDSRKDNISSPYIVHRLKDGRGKKGSTLTHPTQCRTGDISEEFSKTRDELHLYNDLPKKSRPTFHEIRSLSIYLYGKQGLDPQERAAHTDAKTTKKYMEGHIEWVQIQAAELLI